MLGIWEYFWDIAAWVQKKKVKVVVHAVRNIPTASCQVFGEAAITVNGVANKNRISVRSIQGES